MGGIHGKEGTPGFVERGSGIGFCGGGDEEGGGGVVGDFNVEVVVAGRKGRRVTCCGLRE